MYREIVQWRQIRRRLLEDGTPKKQVARETGISRRTLNRILAYEGPPGYGPRPPYYPKLDPYIACDWAAPDRGRFFGSCVQNDDPGHC